MKKGQYSPERLNAFIDAVIAIILTVLVLELPQPNEPTLKAFWSLRVHFLAYIISFIEIFGIWRGFYIDFQHIKVVDWKVIYTAGFQLMTVSLLPYFTSFVAEHSHSIFAEYVFIAMWFVNIIAGYLFYWAVDAANKKVSDKKIADDLGSDVRDILGGVFMLGSIVAIPFWPESGLLGTLLGVIIFSLPESVFPFLGIHVTQVFHKKKS